jgi:cobalamin biosynthesis Mg chelatase CobN
MKRLTQFSMASALLTMSLALPINAQQTSPGGSSGTARQRDTTTTTTTQQPSNTNSTTTSQDRNTTTSQDRSTTSSQDRNTRSTGVDRETASPTGSTQPGPITSSDYTGTRTTSSAPNWILAIIALAIGVGIGYLLGNKRPGMRPSTGPGMQNPGRA